jgi:hypothetical protein
MSAEGFSAEGAARATAAKRAVARVEGFILEVGDWVGWLDGKGECWSVGVEMLEWLRIMVRRKLVVGEGRGLALYLDDWL